MGFILYLVNILNHFLRDGKLIRTIPLKNKFSGKKTFQIIMNELIINEHFL